MGARRRFVKGQGAWQGGEGEGDTRGEKDEERGKGRERERETRRGDSGRLKACAKRGRDRGERSSVGEVIDTGTAWRRRAREIWR